MISFSVKSLLDLKEKTARECICRLQMTVNSFNALEQKAKDSPTEWTWATPLMSEFVDLETKLKDVASSVKDFINDFKASCLSPLSMRGLAPFSYHSIFG